MSRASGGAVAERSRTSSRSGREGRRARSSSDATEDRAKRSTPNESTPTGPRPVWSGSISFGLVNIPVRLFTAVREQRVAFHLLHDQDKVRLRRKLVCPADGKEVHPEHIVRGFEVSKDHFIVVRDEELEGCAPEKTRAIEITDFVELNDIDPIFYDRPYYVLPQKGAARSYRLLAEAMKRSGRVGVARVVMHDKEYLAALRTVGDMICLSTMHFGDEVVPPTVIEGVPHDAGKVPDRELKSAQKVIDSHSGNFDATKYHDRYRECLTKMIENKARHEKVVSPPPEQQDKPKQQTAKAGDLMAALEASLARARKANPSHSQPGSNGHRRKGA
jgi:DNA end-binding protein Ku